MALSARKSPSSAARSASLLWSTTCAVFASPFRDAGGDRPKDHPGTDHSKEDWDESVADHAEDGASTDPGESALGDTRSMDTGESITESDAGSLLGSMSDPDEFYPARRVHKQRNLSDAESSSSWASCPDRQDVSSESQCSGVGPAQAELERCHYTRGALLRLRESGRTRESVSHNSHVAAGPLLPLQALPQVPPQDLKSPAKSPNLGFSPKSKVSSPSAASSLLAGRPSFDDAEVLRTVKAILNKLTVEKFETLYEKLITSCCIRTRSHMQLLVFEIFEKATTQRHFVGMYADLCMRLERDLDLGNDSTFAANDAPSDETTDADGLGSSFRRALLDHCQIFFERSLQQVNQPDTSLDFHEKSERRNSMLGNVRLFGELLVRRMLSSNILVTCCEDLLQQPLHPDRLEGLAALLTCTGPFFDNDAWPRHASLKVVFWQLQGLCCDTTVPSRVRCLLRDVVDLRDAGWVDTKVATRVAQPKRIAEIHCDAAKKVDRAAPGVVSPSTGEKDDYDLAVFHRRLADAMRKLATDHNPRSAAQKVRMLRLPAQHQAAEFANILTRAAEELDRDARRSAFAFAVSLVDSSPTLASSEGAFSKHACAEGIEAFFEDGLFEDLCDEIPGLAGIVSTEMLPSFRGIIPALRIDALRRSVAVSAMEAAAASDAV